MHFYLFKYKTKSRTGGSKNTAYIDQSQDIIRQKFHCFFNSAQDDLSHIKFRVYLEALATCVY